MENQTETIPTETVAEFTEKLNQFIAVAMQMDGRLTEIEKAVGYLLTKDADWMKAFNEANQEVGNFSVSPENPLE